jgi:hypothetical protein
MDLVNLSETERDWTRYRDEYLRRHVSWYTMNRALP